MSGRILLTGGTGFLGARVAAHLVDAGHEVVLLAREDSSTRGLARAGIEARVRVLRPEPTAEGLLACVAETRPDAVAHLAAVSRAGAAPADVAGMVEANVVLPALLLAAMREAGVRRFLNTGTSWQNAAGDAYSPFDVYAGTKQALEDLLVAYCVDGMRAITLRLFDTYGPHDARGKVVDLIARASIDGAALAMSPGEQVIDLAHVDDVARAYGVALRRLCAGEAAGHEVFGVSGERLSLRALAERVSVAAGQPAPIRWGGRPYRAREVMRPWSGFAPLPDWAPRIPLDEGLRALVQARRVAHA